MINVDLCTWLYSKIFGRCVGRDMYGNCYYESRYNFVVRRGHKKRWVIYSQNLLHMNEATMMSNEWFNWLSYRSNVLPHHIDRKLLDWEAYSSPNMTGTVKRNAASKMMGRSGNASGSVSCGYTKWYDISSV